MRIRLRGAGAAPELTLATGLVWGHVKARQFDAALALARGCLQVWPDDPALRLMAAYAGLEEGEDPPAGAGPVAPAGAASWLRLLRRRAPAGPWATAAAAIWPAGGAPCST